MSDLRETLEAAVQEFSDDGAGAAGGDGGGAPAGSVAVESGPAATPTVEAAPPEPKPDAGRARGPDGKFAKATAPQPVAEAPAGTNNPPTPGGTPPVSAEAPAAPAPPSLKPPQSWKPQAREKWSALPPEIQAEIDRREREIPVALQDAAGAKKYKQDMDAVIQPYEGMIRAEGGDPFKAVSSMLQTAAALRTALPQHKAQLIANLVRQFNVPIDALDSELSSAPQGHGSTQGQGANVGPPSDPRVDQLFQRLEQMGLQRQQSAQQKMEQEVRDFAAKNEFFEDVRPQMEGLFRAGIANTLEDAYNKAVLLNPDVSAAMKQREAAKQAATAQAATQRSRAAASSVRSQPAAAPTGEPADLRSQLEAAIAAASGR